MRKTIAAASVAASVAVGGLFGSVVGVPAVAGATETAGGAVSWVEEALAGLVGDGTITQEQADAVETALDDARPERGGMGHRGGFGRHVDLAVLAEALELTEDELRSALEADQTLADIAAEQGVEVQAVVDAIVEAKRAHLAEEVADGDLTQEQADEHLAHAEERATALVEGDMPALGRGGPGGHHRHFGQFGGGADGRTGPEGDDTAA